MSEQLRKRPASPFIVWPLCVFFMVVVYLGSYGPVVGLLVHQWISADTFEVLCNTVYFPIFWIDCATDFFHENPVGQAYARYVDWWILNDSVHFGHP
jgi:hypothetical protein